MASGNFTRSLARLSFDANNQKCSFFKSIGSPEGKKCSRYHQNADEIRFLSRSDSSPYHHWGGGGGHSPLLGGSAQQLGALADPGGTKAMASPKRQTREAKLSFSLPQTGQWVYLVSMGDGTGRTRDRSPAIFWALLCLWAFHGKNRHQTVLDPPPPPTNRRAVVPPLLVSTESTDFTGFMT